MAGDPRIRGEHYLLVQPAPEAADHPRIRGEHESSTSRSRPSPGSSPHTRGALQPGRGDGGCGGIIPAGVHRHIDAFIDVEKHFSLPWRDFHGRVDRYGGA